MRVIVCLRREDETQRVLWLNESKSGIYVGVFNGVVDTHVSYHQDGTRHFRVAANHHQRWKDAPLAAHYGLKQLIHTSIGVNDHPLRLPIDPPTERDRAVVLNEHDFAGFDSLAVDVWLADQRNYDLLDKTGRTVHLAGGFKHVAFHTWDLESFEGLRCGVSFWAANTRGAPVEA